MQCQRPMARWEIPPTIVQITCRGQTDWRNGRVPEPINTLLGAEFGEYLKAIWMRIYVSRTSLAELWEHLKIFVMRMCMSRARFFT